MEYTIRRQEQCRIVSGEKIGQIADLLAGEREIYMVFDRNAFHVARQVGETTGAIRRSFALDASEEGKSIQSAVSLVSLLLEAEATRDALILAVGGGITSDLTGFAASIYKRGIRYANIPTTLLAQVDAAIGGKTGVNFLGYKNMIGTIVQPQWTFLCAGALDTLPARELRSGAAELLKTFLIEDGAGHYGQAVALFSALNRAEDLPDALRANRAALQELILAAAAVKAGVVGRDPFERGERRTLNLGHSFAHAIEALQMARPGGCHGGGCCHGGGGCHDEGDHGQEHECHHGGGEGCHGQGHECHHGDGEGCHGQEHECHHGGQEAAGLSHGEAVAVGILLAARLAEGLHLAESGLAARLEADWRACGLPTECPFPIEKMARVLAQDKKAADGRIRFILPVRPGKVIETPLTPEEALALL